MKSIIVFFLMVLTDVLWAFYIRRTGEGKAFIAAVMAGMLLLLGGYVVLFYTENHMMLIPATLGAFAGTYLTIRFDKPKKTKGEEAMSQKKVVNGVNFLCTNCQSEDLKVERAVRTDDGSIYFCFTCLDCQTQNNVELNSIMTQLYTHGHDKKLTH